MYKFWTPLINFYSEIPEIKLADGIIIRESSTQEKEIILNAIREFYTIGDGEFILECTFNQESPEPNLEKDVLPRIENIITILRLYKESLVGYNFVAPVGFHQSNNRLLMNKGARLRNIRYTVSQLEKDEFVNFFTKYYVEEKLEKIKLVLNYFNRSYYEPYEPTISLVDIMIALDNLYLLERGQGGDTLARRAACVLGNNSDEMNKIFNDVQHAYYERNNIIHGKNEAFRWLNHDFFFEIRNYARESIKIFIERSLIGNKVFLNNVVLKYYIPKVRNIVSNIYNAFYTWRGLQKAEYNVIYKKNKYFWGTTIVSLQLEWLMGIAMLFEQFKKGKEVISIPFLLEFISEGKPKEEIKNEIAKQEPILNNLWKWRCKILAHKDVVVADNIQDFHDKYPIRGGDPEAILDSAEKILGMIESTIVSNGVIYSFKHIKEESERDVEQLIKESEYFFGEQKKHYEKLRKGETADPNFPPEELEN